MFVFTTARNKFKPVAELDNTTILQTHASNRILSLCI